jgi:hypothetical protein
MQLPRISIARAMVAIGIAALAISVFRTDLTDWQVYRIWHEYVIGVVPMACVLSYGLFAAASDVLRRGRCHPFLVGFEVFGWGSLFAYASFMAVNFEAESRPLDWIFPLTRYVFQTGTIEYKDPWVVTFHLLVLNLPELAMALIGGWATSSLSIVVARTSEVHTIARSRATSGASRNV